MKILYDNNYQASQLTKKFTFLQMRMRSDENLVSWIARVENEAASCLEAGVAVEAEVVAVILQGLTESFIVIKTVILATYKDLKKAEVLQALTNYEAANRIADETESISAMAVSKGTSKSKGIRLKRMKSISCGKEGCICRYSRKLNHRVSDCFAKRRGEPKVTSSKENPVENTRALRRVHLLSSYFYTSSW